MKEDEEIEEVRCQFGELMNAYLNVIEHSDKLAEMMQIEDSNSVLREVLPTKFHDELRSTIRGEDWFNGQLEVFKLKLYGVDKEVVKDPLEERRLEFEEARGSLDRYGLPSSVVIDALLALDLYVDDDNHGRLEKMGKDLDRMQTALDSMRIQVANEYEWRLEQKIKQS